MKKIIKKALFLFVFSLIFISNSAFAGSSEKLCPDPNCDDPISQYAQEILNAQRDFYDKEFEKMANVDYSALETCLNSAEGAFNLSGLIDSIKNFKVVLPDFDEIMQKACMTVISEMKSQFNQIENSLTNLIPYNGEIDFNDFSQDIANGVLDKVFDPAGSWVDNALDKLPTDIVDNLPGLDDIPTI